MLHPVRAPLRLVVPGFAVMVVLTGVLAHAQTVRGRDDPGRSLGDLDALMERVLAQRDLDRLKMRDYVIDERETVELTLPGGLVIEGWRKDFVWYVRDGILVRSPVRANGVAINEAERLEQEAIWMAEERRRADRRRASRRSVSRRSAARNIALAIEREWGRRVDEDLAERIARDADIVGDDHAALVLRTPDILAALGGLDVVGFNLAAARTRDLFVMLDRELLTNEEVTSAVEEMLVTLSDGAEAANGSEYGLFLELVRLAGRFGTTASGAASTLRGLAHRLDARSDLAGRAAALAEARLVWGEAATGERSGDPAGTGTPVPEVMAPRFLSATYFLDLPFEPGNYYVVGREALAGRDVIVIEYYPERWLGDPSRQGDQEANDIGMKLDKTSLVTLWIDPRQSRIVKFVFENVRLDFLPGRWLLRVDQLDASMMMGQPFEDVWMPETITAGGRVTTAAGSLELNYRREFHEYREAETSGRVRSYGEPDGG